MRPLLLLLALAACDESPPERPPVPLPEGVVAQGTAARAAALAEPGPPVDEALLAEGRRGFATFCAPCHGPAGAGDGVVTRHSHPPIPPLPREAASSMRAMAVNLHGAHPSEGRIPPPLRWAIARHVERLP